MKNYAFVFAAFILAFILLAGCAQTQAPSTPPAGSQPSVQPPAAPPAPAQNVAASVPDLSGLDQADAGVQQAIDELEQVK